MRVPIANLKGPRGRTGPRGLPGTEGVPTSEAIGENLAAADTPAFEGAAQKFLTDDASVLNGKRLLTRGDSFGKPISVPAAFSELLADERGMTLTDQNVSASYDRDAAMRANGSPLIDRDVVILTGGVNPARLNADGLTRQAEISALQLSILLACAGSRLETSAATESGTWFDLVSPVFSNGAARQSITEGSKYTWTPAWGDYFAAGFSARDGIESLFASGTWKRGSTVVAASRATAPPHTYLEANDADNSARGFVPWVVMFPALSGSESVSVEAPGTGLTTVDALWKIADVPPLVIVLNPGDTRSGLPLSIDPADLEIFRGDRRAAVAGVTAAFPRLRGHVIVADVKEYGWDPAVHTVAGEGLHPDTVGHELISTAVQRSTARARLLAPLMPSFGVVGPSWPAWG